MNLKSPPELTPFIISWNLRNICGILPSVDSEEFRVIGTELGKYPIDAWNSYFIEIPANEFKKDIVGRTHQAFGVALKNTKWNSLRVIAMPKYCIQNKDISNGSNADKLEKLKLIIRHWTDAFIPDEIPCVAIAVKCKGYNSDNRELQSVSVLLIWNDSVGRIISFNWTEGPVEDCITPEWYVESTPLLNLRDAICKMQKSYENISWDSPTFSIYTIPSCIGDGIHGKLLENPSTLWEFERRYSEYIGLKTDLDFVLSLIWNLFSENLCTKWNGDLNG